MLGAEILITVNGELKAIPPNFSVSDLLDLLSLKNQRLAVELNGEILSRTQFSCQILNVDDRLELVQAIGGG
ncbi:MAG: thiamine biosynthesis protein ThiS [Halothiobacillus sp. 20-53-49]|nr:sulfur carrier protein ThiS [Halothiobacillaceae bacterium]OYV44753.1 MAG: thiamine biosynthesis protein ThiS [Halothiobacillus sp. 20-53-49]HUN01006.1 sulfur carrier protein ThiS [Halothiobacillus sp.]